MAKFVKKVGNRKFYEIDEYRAGGIIPYFIDKNKVYILMNKEFREHKLKYHFLGGKVENTDRDIQETCVREFNEETGYILNCIKIDLMRYISRNCKNITIKKSKYISYLINIKNIGDIKLWLNLPKIFNDFYKDTYIEHNESLCLKWCCLKDISHSKNLTYLSKIILFKLNRVFRKNIPRNDIFLD